MVMVIAETPPRVPLPPCAASIVKRWSVFCRGKSNVCALFYKHCCMPQSRDSWRGLIANEINKGVTTTTAEKIIAGKPTATPEQRAMFHSILASLVEALSFAKGL